MKYFCPSRKLHNITYQNCNLNNHTFECILGIIVKFKGEAECKWTERRTVTRHGKSETVTRHYRGYEKYFENSNRVFGGTGELT
jgi:hypothetical protein